MSAIDPATGRPFGDHGLMADAMDYALDLSWEEQSDFINDWTHGDLTEWPEFYPWLAKREASSIDEIREELREEDAENARRGLA